MSILNLAYGKNTPTLLPYLCFTAEEANSTIALNKNWTPTAVTLETSTDGNNWSTYTFGDTITLTNIWDKVYWRNTSETTTGFSKNQNDYYIFVMGWIIDASWDISYILNKNWETSLSSIHSYCFYNLFSSCWSLKTPPRMPFTTLAPRCYTFMYGTCIRLASINDLPATTLTEGCYYQMYRGCPNINISTTQSETYPMSYRIPTTWTWTTASDALKYMFSYTWWTFTWTPTINTTYYTSNTVV